MDGFWIYLPKGSAKPAANVVVFVHGYGAYNPMIFGAWIRHLVEDGNIVIYPRYQKTLYSPRPKNFVAKALKGVNNALGILEARGYNSNLWSSIDVIGHSYGGVISMNFAQHRKSYKLPPIANLMIISAGSGPFKGGVLNAYDHVDANLVIIDSDNDTTVGDVFSRHVDSLTVDTENKVYLHQGACSAGNINLSCHHNEPYALDYAFDNEVRNYTAKKALRVGRTNILDTNGYWKIFDKMIESGAEFELFDAGKKEWLLSQEYPTIRLTVN